MLKRKQNLKITKNTVIKTCETASSKIEFIKMTKAKEISSMTGLFYVPEVYDYQEDKGIIVMEKIKDLKGIRNFKFSKASYKDLIINTAKSLAVIHDELHLPKEMIIPIQKKIDHSDGRVFIHGDFSTENISISSTNPRTIVIIDWQMTKIYGGSGTYGTRYFDLSWFINNLFSVPFYKYFYSLNVSEYAGLFVSTYFENCKSYECNIENFSKYLIKFYRHKLQDRKMHLLKHFLLKYGHNQWLSFNRSLRK